MHASSDHTQHRGRRSGERRASITRSSPRHRSRLDAPATVTFYTAPLSDVSGMAADPFAIQSRLARSHRRASFWSMPPSSTGNARATARSATSSHRPTPCSSD